MAAPRIHSLALQAGIGSVQILVTPMEPRSPAASCAGVALIPGSRASGGKGRPGPISSSMIGISVRARLILRPELLRFVGRPKQDTIDRLRCRRTEVRKMTPEPKKPVLE
jgi:hypothetical protein